MRVDPASELTMEGLTKMFVFPAGVNPRVTQQFNGNLQIVDANDDDAPLVTFDIHLHDAEFAEPVLRTDERLGPLAVKAMKSAMEQRDELRDALLALRDAVKASGAMNTREYIDLGIKVNAALVKVGAA